MIKPNINNSAPGSDRNYQTNENCLPAIIFENIMNNNDNVRRFGRITIIVEVHLTDWI